MSTLLRSLAICGVLTFTAVAQPVVTGALNTASYAVPGLPSNGLAQGSMIAIFGQNIGPGAIAQAGSFPLPTAPGGSSAKITVGGRAGDLIMAYSVCTKAGAIARATTPAC